MADQNVKVILTAENKTAAGIGSAKTGIESLVSTAKKFAAAAGIAFATKQLFDFGKASVEAFAEAEASTAKVSAILKTLPASLNVSTDEITKLASAATKLGLSDEQAAENIAFFLQRTNDLTEATKLNALAMDLARAKNIDLGTAANLVGQVLSGNGRALKQFGIEIDETLGPMAALDQLQGKVAGQAEAFAGTTGGQLQVLSESWNNFQEAIGAALSEALVPFLQEMIKIVSDPRFIEFFTQMAKVISTVVIVSVKTLQGAFEELVHIWEVVLSTIDRIKAGFDALVAAASRVGSAISGGLSAASSRVFGGGRASGGPVMAGSAYLVGERGPEIFQPRSAGDIIPNGRLAGGGGMTINITGNTLLDEYAGEKIASQIMRALKGNLRL